MQTKSFEIRKTVLCIHNGPALQEIDGKPRLILNSRSIKLETLAGVTVLPPNLYPSKVDLLSWVEELVEADMEFSVMNLNIEVLAVKL